MKYPFFKFNTVPPHALKMLIVSTETVLAGEAVMLQISAIKMSGFTYEQLIFCTNQNEIPLSELEGFDFPEPPTNIGSILNLPVSVNPVLLSHACLYICTAFLETPSLLDNISDTANTSIRVKSKCKLISFCIMHFVLFYQ